LHSKISKGFLLFAEEVNFIAIIRGEHTDRTNIDKVRLVKITLEQKTKLTHYISLLVS
jgi:uncharacterized protein YifE (UPF0438 family)